MKIPEWLPCYGDPGWRGPCPKEGAEQLTFFTELRKRYPDTLGIIALHPKNEGKRRGAQFHQLNMDKAKGMADGASDIVIPGGPTFVCELKRRDRTQCKWEPGQLPYLKAAQKCGAFVCLALGWEAAMQAVEVWLSEQRKTPKTIRR